MANLQEIVKWIETNPLLLTVTSSGAIIWLFTNIRNIWSTLVNAIKTCISFEINNTYEDSRGQGQSLKLRQIAFNQLLMSSKSLWEKTLNLDLCEYVNEKNKSIIYAASCNDIYLNTSMVDSYGFSIRFFLGKLITVARSYKLDGQRITMNTHIRVYFASKKKFMRQLTNEIDNRITEIFNMNKNSSYLEVVSDSSTGGTSIGVKNKRYLNSVFTKNDIHIDLFNDIKNFIDNRKLYESLNYPYKYCALLHGEPGTGKTSTILAIASELNRYVTYVNIATISMQQLARSCSQTSKTIFVFEDIDAVAYKNANSRQNSKSNDDADFKNDLLELSGLSLSDLLNFTDGLLASDGAICLFTTNHIDKLDPAFLRAGRMNKIVEFKYMSPDTSKKMVEKYLGVSLDSMIDNIKPAELQEMILDVLLKKKTIDDLKHKFCTSIN